MAQRPSGTSSTLHPQSTPRADGDPHQPSSLPPWVHINDESNDTPLLDPRPTVPNTRHYKPPHPNLAETRQPPAHYKPGRKWDHLRSASPPMLSRPIDEHQERWRTFMQSGPEPYEEGSRLVSQEWLEVNMPHLNRPWTPTDALLAEGNHGQAEGWWIFSAERQQRTVSLFWVSLPGSRDIRFYGTVCVLTECFFCSDYCSRTPLCLWYSD